MLIAPLTALLISLHASAVTSTGAPSITPAEALKNDIHALIPRGDLVNFEVLKETHTGNDTEIVYTISYVKNHAIVRQLTRARYRKQKGAWVLTQVAPLDRQIEFLDQ